MITKAISHKENSNILTRSWHWLRSVDEAIHYDPVENLNRKIHTLESRLAKIESNLLTGKGGGK